MRIKIHILLSILISLSCSADDAVDTTTGTCLPSQDLVIVNSSEYTVNHLYAHDTLDYYNDTAKSEIAADMATGDIVYFPVSYGDIKYFTFFRNIISTSTSEIAVTTANPVVIEECYMYTMHILEEEFSIDRSENYAAK